MTASPATDATYVKHPQVALRPPEEVMRLKRMGSFFPSRLSFVRSMLRCLAADNVQVERPVWEMDTEGYGRAVYSLSLGGHVYSLVAFSTRLEPTQRTDRVIAEAWDSSYVLYDGIPSTEELDRLQANAPLQEAGRFQPTDLVLSRANKSVRLFAHVAERLSQGQQPDEDMIASIGYLMRTTAVYGNGKFGIADRLRIIDRPMLADPFRVEMLTVWLIRGFTHDLVEYVAQQKNPESFAPLEKRFKHYLGIGNSTGLGMAPFLVSHPILINNWMMVRETALARVRAIEDVDAQTVKEVNRLLTRASEHLEQWNVPDNLQMKRIVTLRVEVAALRIMIENDFLLQAFAWDKLIEHSKQWSMECQEFIVSLALEPYGELLDGLTSCMGSVVLPRLDPAMTLGELHSLIKSNFDWTLDIDFESEAGCKQFWYVSEEKLEPRLGNRFEEAGAELELPLDIARQVQMLDKTIATLPKEQTLATFLIHHPEHRYVARRIQTNQQNPYSEIQDNLIGENCLPIDMLRCKLSFFGAAKFDPKSDRWTRITLFQGAPLFDEIHKSELTSVDDWWLPVLEPIIESAS